METPVLSTDILVSNIASAVHLNEEDAYFALECVGTPITAALRRSRETRKIRGFLGLPELSREDLVASVVEGVEISRKKAETVVGAIEDTIWDELEENDRVEVLPFGTFSIDRNSAVEDVTWAGQTRKRQAAEFEPLLPSTSIDFP